MTYDLHCAHDIIQYNNETIASVRTWFLIAVLELADHFANDRPEKLEPGKERVGGWLHDKLKTNH